MSSAEAWHVAPPCVYRLFFRRGEEHNTVRRCLFTSENKATRSFTAVSARKMRSSIRWAPSRAASASRATTNALFLSCEMFGVETFGLPTCKLTPDFTTLSLERRNTGRNFMAMVMLYIVYPAVDSLDRARIPGSEDLEEAVVVRSGQRAVVGGCAKVGQIA